MKFFWIDDADQVGGHATPKIVEAVLAFVEIHFVFLHLLLCNTFVSHLNARN